MASQDTFFKVKTGLGVGTNTLYADAELKQVAIGATVGNYELDVYGTIYGDSDALVAGNVGVGTLIPVQRLDVRGIGIVTGFGVGTTAPKQTLQINDTDPVVVTNLGYVGINTLSPIQPFQLVGDNSTNSVVITGFASIGIRSESPQFDLHYRPVTEDYDIVIDSNGFIGLNNTSPEYNLDIAQDVRVSGFATITNENVGISTVGIASVTNEVVGISTVGIATVGEEYVGFSTVGIATVGEEYVGISTVGIATVGEEYVGFSTVGIATVGEEYVGFSTVGIATVGEEYVGISTVGIASVTNEVVGISTVGIATVGEEYVGISTVGIATVGEEYVGVSTVGISSVTEEYVGFSTVGFATVTAEYVLDSEMERLLVTGITTTSTLDVGIGATILRARGFETTTVNDITGNFIKDINPLIGIATTEPTRTLDISGDLRVRGEIIDSNNQVGYAYSVLASSGSPSISGRFIDGANLLLRNKDFIANEIVGFITSIDGPFGSDGEFFDYGPVGPVIGREKCKRDIGLIIDAIAFDITKGGNSQSVGAGISYSLGNYLESTDPAPAAGLEGFDGGYVKYATLVGINSIATIGQYVINNARLPVSYQVGVTSSSQLIDTEIAPDGDSNTNYLGCANVTSAIYSAVGIVTTIIDVGLEASGISTTYPSGELVWQPPGPRIGNEWFVNKLGDDSNGGTGPGDAFLTIKKAASIAQPGDTIKVYAGLYIEDGPISLNERVAVVGEDLRRTLVTTRDKTDLFYVKRGCYVSHMSFVGESNPGKAMVSFPTQGYGYADGTEENWQSPYVQNCTNFVPDSIGMRIDGNRAGGFKSMVLDAFTQYNQGGIGVSITNFGYAQLVSLFTICCDTAVFCDSGGVCDLNNSNSSFGNYGLVANGATPLQYTGTIESDPEGDNVDNLIINVGVGASQEFKDSVTILRANKDFIASEVVGFITSTDGPFGIDGENFDYGGSVKGRDFCRRDSKIIIEQICSDILTLGNANSIDAGLAYRDSPDGSLTYLNETNPPPAGFTTGYVKDAEIAAIEYIADLSYYIVRNLDVPISYQSGVGTFPQVKVSGMTTSDFIDDFISSRSSIITDIIGIGTNAVPTKILPKGQRPYDGQIAVIGTQYYFVSRIDITDPGSGYDPNLPVNVTIDLPPDSDLFIPAEAAVFENGINEDGTIETVEILVSGTGYGETPPNVIIEGPPGVGTTATAVAVMEKLFFNPVSSTPVSAGGTTTVTFDEFITYSPLVGAGDTVYFYQSSKIIASSITFEYIGTGINIVNAIPSKGAVPIDDNQTVATNGGKIPFTSTDQSGDFRISEGITINQNTGTISGQAFSKSLQAEVTPLIIALQQ
jgi:hypothetical protein